MMECDKCSKKITVSEYHYIASKQTVLCNECMEKYLAIAKKEIAFWNIPEVRAEEIRETK